MTKVDSFQAQNHFSELLSHVVGSGDRVAIEQEGQAVAAIISYADLQRLEALEDALDSAALRRAVAEDEGLVTIEEVIAGYNSLHHTNFDLNTIIND